MAPQEALYLAQSLAEPLVADAALQSVPRRERSQGPTDTGIGTIIIGDMDSAGIALGAAGLILCLIGTAAEKKSGRRMYASSAAANEKALAPPDLTGGSTSIEAT